MPRLPLYKLCRLCLCSSGELLDIFSETTDLEFTVGNALEDLLQVEISQEKNYPWLVCRTCLDKLSDFRLFKRRCLESLFVFNNRVRQSDFSRSNLASGVVKKTVKGESGKGLKMVRKALRETERAQGCDTAPSASGRDPEGDAVPSGRMTEGGNALGGPETNTIDACNAGISDRMSITVKDNAFDMDLSEEKYLAVPTGEELIRQGGGEPGSTADNSCEGSSFAEEELSVNQDGEVDDEVYKRHFMSSPSREEMPEDSEANVNSTSSYQARVQASGNREHGIGDQSPMDQDCGATVSGPSENIQRTSVELGAESNLFGEVAVGSSRELLGVPIKQETPEEAIFKPAEQSRVLCVGKVMGPGGDGKERVRAVVEARTVDGGRGNPLNAYRYTMKSVSTEMGPERTARIQTPVTNSASKQERSKLCLGDNYIEILSHKAGTGLKLRYNPQRKRIFQCALCGTKFCTKGEVIIHLKEHKGKYQCYFCDAEFGSNAERSRHLVSDHEGKELPGNGSEDEGGGGGERRRGKVVAGKPRFKCGHCPKLFVDKSNLARHLVSHDGEPRHKCGECGKAFAKIASLRTHVVIHSGERPFACAVCPMRFARESCLRKHHSGVHLKIRPHSCGFCDKSFPTLNALKTHETVHSDEKPFACHHCSKSFGQKCQLRAHMSVHTGVKAFKCRYCEKSFTLRHYLRDHEAKHTGVLEIRCRWCRQVFGSREEMLGHMKTNHRDSLRQKDSNSSH
ncbi:zinc finger protein 208-like isoform X1 [Ischnura elegans]|uniref:zinc finger protein 208-like isoform X1 n=1 Tax=Ischnura elegans TaxID=197161 RepID=UPI001ED89110|nr:zinc finger protein 208-like isoform X1 [Ischnura elegans]